MQWSLALAPCLLQQSLASAPSIPTITLSIQHEGPLLSQALGIFTMNMSTHFGKHYLCGKCTCLSLKTSSKKKSQTMNQVCSTLAESQQPLVWNNGNRQLMLPLLRREENTERTKRQLARVCSLQILLGWTWKSCSAQDGVMVFHLLGPNEEGIIVNIPLLLVWTLVRMGVETGDSKACLLHNFCLPSVSFRLGIHNWWYLPSSFYLPHMWPVQGLRMLFWLVLIKQQHLTRRLKTACWDVFQSLTLLWEAAFFLSSLTLCLL